MIEFITLVIIGYFIVKAVKHERNAFCEEADAVKEDPIDRMYREQKEAQEAAIAEAARIAALEKEQDRQWKEQLRLWREQERQAAEIKRHDAEIAKHDDAIAKLQFQYDQSVSKIESIDWKLEELQKKAKYLELERDSAVYGGKEYWKWQDKISTVDDKIQRLNEQKAKAQFVIAEAQRKMAA